MPNFRVDLSDIEGDSDGDEPSQADHELDDRYDALLADFRDLGAVFSPAADHDLPSVILVGARSYEMRVVVDTGLDGHWDALLGSTNPHRNTVAVRADQSRNELRETILHEVLHAVDEAAGTEAGESVVNAWAPVLLDVLRRNPDLVSLLLADDSDAAPARQDDETDGPDRDE